MESGWMRWDVGAGDVLFEDGYLIAVNKPAGLPSQATPDPRRDHCYAAVGRYLGKGGYVGLHHRLDALTSGVLLMTKDPSANAGLGEQFREHRVRKVYDAICFGDVLEGDGARAVSEREGIDIHAPIGELPGGGVQRFGTDGRHRRPALTHVVCESSVHVRDGVVAAFRCMPLTGRTHQIRVHLSSIGLGIVGDPLYGGRLPRSLRAVDPERMCLHAASITFLHPVTGEEVTVSAPRPRAFDSFLAKVGKIAKVERR